MTLIYTIPSIASTCERTRAKHVFTWRQKSEFHVSNFQVFPPKCEVLLLNTVQRENDSNQQERKKWSERRPTFNNLRNQVTDLVQDYSFSEAGRRLGCSFKNRYKHCHKHYTSHLGGKTSTFDTWNSDVWHHMKTCFARVRSRVDAINGNKYD